jgi:hypothetical protein
MSTSNPTLQDSVEQLANRVAELEAIVEEQSDTIEQQQETIEEQADRIDELEETGKQERRRTAKVRGQLKSDVAEIEDRLDSSNPEGPHGEDTSADAHTRPETSLEQTTALPEEMVEEESANVQRAVFIARDVSDYTTSVPAGRAITSGELRRVLRAGTDCNGHSQTVDRVIQVLDDLGGEGTKVVERRNERRVVFTDDLCQRLGEITQQDTNHDVVIGQEV